jgi:hypothetical protein
MPARLLWPAFSLKQMRETLEVRSIEDAGVRDWLAVPRYVYRNDPRFVPRLDMLERRRISRPSNPFLQRNQAEFFIAYRNGAPVGRISAQINHDHVARHECDTGHFGFFDVENDLPVAHELLSAASRWLSSRGMKKVAGPFSLSINEESGLLVSGFDLPAAAAMPHSAPWQPRLLAAEGFYELRKLFAFRFKPKDVPNDAFRQIRVARKTDFDSRITVRGLNKSDFENELRTIAAIFNDGSQDKWGFVPLREDELSFAIGEFKMLLRANYVKFVCINDEPQGFLFWMPNLAELTASFNGRLFPLHWIQLLYNAAFERFTSARVPLIGIRKSHQSRWRSITLVTILFESLLKDLQLYELEWMELSWIVDTNRVLVDFLRSTLGEPTRVYSVFGADIA